MQSRWAQVEQLLREFQTLLTPDVMQLNIEKGIDCLATDRSVQECPALKQPGVYLIFDEHEELLYVGSATARPLINRIRVQLSRARFGVRSRWVDIIPFKWDWAFFVPALELYLIRQLVLSRMTEGKGSLVNEIGMFAGVREWLIKGDI